MPLHNRISAHGYISGKHHDDDIQHLARTYNLGHYDMNWKVERLKGVSRELDALPDDMRASYMRIGRLVEEEGLGRVASRSGDVKRMKGVPFPLWEMRMRGRDRTASRALCVEVEDEQTILVLRVFIKKTEKTPKKEIDVARERFRRWADSP